MGVRVKKGSTYHGLAINIDMDMEPFNGINPCGYEGMKCIQLSSIIKDISIQDVKQSFPKYLLKHLDQSSEKLSDVA